MLHADAQHEQLAEPQSGQGAHFSVATVALHDEDFPGVSKEVMLSMSNWLSHKVDKVFMHVFHTFLNSLTNSSLADTAAC